MKYMIRFSQTHETFRLAEIHALAIVENVQLKVVDLRADLPFCFIELATPEEASRLIRRSILAKAIYEVWGSAETYEQLQTKVQATCSDWYRQYRDVSFKFAIDAFRGSRTLSEQRDIINSFRYLGFEGPIRIKDPDVEFCVFEEWSDNVRGTDRRRPLNVHLGRFLGGGARSAVLKYDLKKRAYISTTSMDAELSLITANITLAGPAKLFYDPFVGTGSFTVAAAHFGAFTFGSDIDGRNIKGKTNIGIRSNFEQYGLQACMGDNFTADLINTPLRSRRIFDGIICDPPYGVREGLKVLGNRDPSKTKGPVYKDGSSIPHHMKDDYIPPKKAYSFLTMLDDILDFAARMLVDDGRLSFWMPTANDLEQEIAVPEHNALEVVSVCTQSFNRWSRRLITYQRLPDSAVRTSLPSSLHKSADGVHADDLNPFRKAYFKGFKVDPEGEGAAVGSE